ncbi:MAG: transcriptional regulator NrdR [Candidatus Aenigmarchaeota archaeon]|nr:transcriptional regulator NrdR [Candidatus Aenigmarchaeota archaeon]
MLCPYCSAQDSKVVDKRITPDSRSFRRRRECLSCSKRFTTYERVENADLTIVKKDGNRESFDRQKLKSGIIKACEKRPISAEEIDRVINEIEMELRNRDSVEINSKSVGQMVMKKLKRLDKVAYIRFASVYREFTDLESFEDELKKIKKK